ncbi:hypothetical protein GGR56DRAFT_71348 [Xylariaceae sp. FL0804]|nr:hypothetical protein GGR56DRAFT_71348 [Xylariaceae sp. FL0804]
MSRLPRRIVSRCQAREFHAVDQSPGRATESFGVDCNRLPGAVGGRGRPGRSSTISARAQHQFRMHHTRAGRGRVSPYFSARSWCTSRRPSACFLSVPLSRSRRLSCRPRCQGTATGDCHGFGQWRGRVVLNVRRLPARCRRPAQHVEGRVRRACDRGSAGQRCMPENRNRWSHWRLCWTYWLHLRQCADAGVIDDIVVSSHGGRQSDGGCSSLGALPSTMDAVGGLNVVGNISTAAGRRLDRLPGRPGQCYHARPRAGHARHAAQCRRRLLVDIRGDATCPGYV